MTDLEGNDRFSVAQVSWARRWRGKIVHSWNRIAPASGPGGGSGAGTFIGLRALIVIVVVIVVGVFATLPFSDVDPELEDLYRSADYRAHPLTGGARTRNGDMLFASSGGGGLLVVEPHIFRIRSETKGDSGGPSSDDLRDVAAAPDDSVLAITRRTGLGLDHRSPEGEWRALIAATNVKGLEAADVLKVVSLANAMVLVLADGRLAHYDTKARSLTPIRVEGDIPQPVTSAALVGGNRDVEWSLWLAAGGNLVRVDSNGDSATARKVPSPDGKQPLELLASDEDLLVRMQRGALYTMRGGRWHPLLSGEEWPALQLEKARLAVVSEDKSTLWLVPQESSTSPFNIGAYRFDDRRWTLGKLPKDASLALAPIVAADGGRLVLASTDVGFVVLQRGQDGIDIRARNELGGEHIVHMHGDRLGAILTTETAQKKTRRVRALDWSAILEGGELAEPLRDAGRTHLEADAVVTVLPDGERLLFLGTDATLVPYDTKRRGFGLPWKLATTSSHPIGAVLSQGFLWVVEKTHAITRYRLADFGDEPGRVTGEQIVPASTMPDSSLVVRAFATKEGFDLLFADHTAWAYSFSRGWRQVGKGLRAPSLVRLPDGRAICLGEDGRLATRTASKWVSVDAATQGRHIAKLVPGKSKAFVKTTDGAWGELVFPVDAASWRLETLLAAPPAGPNRPATPVTRAIESVDEKSLFLGDDVGLLRYAVASHAWTRLIEAEAGARWSFATVSQSLFALNTSTGLLHSVSLKRPHTVREVGKDFASIAATGSTALGLRKDGRLEWLTGAVAGLPLGTPADQDLQSRHGEIRSAAAFGNEIAVVTDGADLFRYSLREGRVQSVGWNHGSIQSVHASASRVAVLSHSGEVFVARTIRGPYERIEVAEKAKIVAVGAVDKGIFLSTLSGALAFLADDDARPTPLAGGARPSRTPGTITAALIEKDSLVIGGERGIAARSAAARGLVQRPDRDTGAVDRFEAHGGAVFAWTANGLFQRGPQGHFAQIAPQGFHSLVRLGGRQMAFDAAGRLHEVALGARPVQVPEFGGGNVATSTVREALDLGEGRTLLGLEDGSLLTYLGHRRRLVTTRQKTDRRVVYLGSPRAGEVCVISGESEFQYERIRIDADGKIRGRKKSLTGIVAWTVLDPDKWDRPAGNLVLLTKDHAVRRVEAVTLGDPVLTAAASEPREVLRAMARKDDVLLLDEKGELRRYDPKSSRTSRLATGALDLFPLSDGYAILEKDRIVSSGKAQLGRSVSMLRGDGRALAWRAGKDLAVVHSLAKGREVVSLRKATAGPKQIVGLWSSEASADVFFATDGASLFRYDARTASWTEDRKSQFTKMVGTGAEPALLASDSEVLDLASGKRTGIQGHPVELSDGRVIYLTKNQEVREAGAAGSLFSSRPAVPLSGENLSFAVELDGGLVIGMGKTTLWWPKGKKQPVKIPKTMQLPSGAKTWIQSGEKPASLWCHASDGTLYEVSSRSIERRSADPVKLVGMVSGTLVVQRKMDDSVYACEPGQNLKEILAPVTVGRPAQGNAFAIASGPKAGFTIARRVDGTLITRALTNLGGAWRDRSRAWKSVTKVRSSGTTLVIEGVEASGAHKFSIVDNANNGWKARVVRWANGQLSSGARVLNDPRLQLALKTCEWVQHRETGHLLAFDKKTGAFRGRLTVGDTLMLETPPELKSLKRDKERIVGPAGRDYAVLAMGPATPPVDTTAPASPPASIEPSKGSHRIEFANGTTRYLHRGRFHEQEPGEAKLPEALDLRVVNGRIELFLKNAATALFAVAPGQPWPGFAGTDEFVLMNGKFHPVRDGWPVPSTSSHPRNIPEATELRQDIWRVPLAGFQEVVVERKADRWEELAAGHHLAHRTRVRRGPALLTPADLAALANAPSGCDDLGPFYALRKAGDDLLAWSADEGWTRRPPRRLETARVLSVDAKGRVPTDVLRAVTATGKGIVIDTDGGRFLLGTAAPVRAERLTEQTGEVVPPTQRDALLTAKCEQRDGLLSVVFAGSSPRLLHLADGRLAAELIIEVGIDATDATKALVRTRDGVVRSLLAARLSAGLPATRFQKARAPEQLALRGFFRAENGELRWRPKEIAKAIALGRIDALVRNGALPIDRVDGVLPAAQSGLYHRSPSGLWLWRNGKRTAVTDTRIERAFASDRHPLAKEDAAPGGLLSWKAPATGPVAFSIAVGRGAAKTQVAAEFRTSAFDFELPKSLHARNNEVRAVADSGARVECEIGWAGSAINGIHRVTAYSPPPPPEIAGAESPVRFRRTAAGVVAEVRSGDGWIASTRRTPDGQFAHDHVYSAVTAANKLYALTELGVVQSSTDLKELRVLRGLNPTSRGEILAADGKVFVRHGTEVSTWDGRNWTQAADPSPFAPHRRKVTTVGKASWRAVPYGSNGFRLEALAGDGNFHTVDFDSENGVFRHDWVTGVGIDEIARGDADDIEWRTVHGWMTASAKQTTGLPKPVASPKASPRGPTMTTTDRRVRVVRAGGDSAITVISPSAKTKNSFVVPWSVKNGRLAHDRAHALVAVPRVNSYVIATDHGVRELQLTPNGLRTPLFELEGRVKVTEILVVDDEEAVVKDESGSVFRHRVRGEWEPQISPYFDTRRTAAASRPRKTRDARLQWLTHEYTNSLTFRLDVGNDRIVELGLDASGFSLDRPEIVFDANGPWLIHGTHAYRMAAPGKGLRSLERAGSAPDAVLQRATPDFDQQLVVRRGSLHFGLNANGTAWNAPVKLHPNAWSAFLRAGLLVDAPEKGSVSVDWQPPGTPDAKPARVRLHMRDGRFLHDTVFDLAVPAPGAPQRLIYATAAGIATRGATSHQLSDVRSPDETEQAARAALLHTGKGVVYRTGESAWIVASRGAVAFTAAGEYEVEPHHQDHAVRMTQVDAAARRLVFEERLDSGTWVPSQPGIANGHLAGDLVTAAFRDGEAQYWLATTGGVQRVTASKTSGFLRPDGLDGRLSESVPSDKANEPAWPSAWHDSGSLWVAFQDGSGDRVFRRFDADATPHETTHAKWAAARSRTHERPRWRWSSRGLGADLSLSFEGVRNDEVAWVAVTARRGALDVDYCSGLGRAGATALATSSLGAWVLQGAFEKTDLVLPPEQSTVLHSPPRFGASPEGGSFLVAASGEAALQLAASKRSLIETAEKERLDDLQNTQFADATWNIYRDARGVLHVVWRPRDLHLVGERVFEGGQFAFDRVAFVAADPNAGFVVTHAGIERLTLDGRLEADANLDASPTAVGLHEGRLTIAFGEKRLVRDGNKLVPFKGSVILPRDELALSLSGQTLAFARGEVSLDGARVSLTADDALGAFVFDDRLWLVYPETLRWLRLESRWLDRL